MTLCNLGIYNVIYETKPRAVYLIVYHPGTKGEIIIDLSHLHPSNLPVEFMLPTPTTLDTTGFKVLVPKVVNSSNSGAH